MSHAHKLDAAQARAFLVGGSWNRHGGACHTLVSVATQKRFTYKVCAPKEQDENRPVLFVKVLTGSNNESDYSYLGMIVRDGDGFKFITTKATARNFGPQAPSLVAFSWAFPRIAAGLLPDSLEFWHEGSCGMCGRKLTDSESIARGLGPICAKKI